jgi:hypothetical protein
MRTPTTVKGYLKMLMQIADESSYDLKNVTEEEAEFLGWIRASIQNDLGEDKYGVMEKHNLEYTGR